MFLPLITPENLMRLTEQPQTIMTLKKNFKLMKTGNYDADIAKYIPGVPETKFQGMLEDIDTRKKVAHPSYKDMDELDFQILIYTFVFL